MVHRGSAGSAWAWGLLAGAMSAWAGEPAAVPAGPASPEALYLRAGTVDTAAPRRDLAKAIGTRPPDTRFVVQLDGPMTPARRAALARAGVAVGAYLPMHAYVVTLDRADPAAVSALPFIRWWSEYRPQWKLDPEIGRRVYASEARRKLVAQGRDYLVVALFAGADAGAVERALWAIPGTAIVGQEWLGDHLEMVVVMDLARVGALTEIPGVQFVEPAPEYSERNITTRWIVQSNIPGVRPLYDAGLRGEGQIVGIIDSGAVPATHCSFSDTVPIGPSHRKIIAANTTSSVTQHATHVAGIVVGDAGVDDAETRGVAYLGKLAYNRYPSLPAPEPTMAGLLQLHHDQGARVHTNSWGNDGTTAYDSTCRGIDVFQYNNEDSLVLFAVTNTNTLKNPENAKNLLAVGATQDAPNQASHCYGGTGPTSDGRRKPEIYAPGCNIQSSTGTACGTTALSGTSMACPAVAGVAMLVRQYYVAGYYPTGQPTPGSGFQPTAALVKATLLNSAVDMLPAGYPSNQEGWGRVLAINSLYFPGRARKMLIADVRNAAGLSTGQTVEVPVAVLASTEPLRVTLVWTEPAATAGASFAAVNDLDLEVISPASDLYRGNVFNTATGQSVPGGTRDDRNNVEQVHITSPSAGPWTVRIRGTNVAQGTQGYALIATGDIQSGTPPPLYISLPGGVPARVPPGAATNLDVTVQPGSQNVVPGSPRLWFRRSGTGAFIPTTLLHLGGTSYQATLPGLMCTDSPQFYFTAQGDGGATVSLPSTAPVHTFSTTVGTTTIVTVLSESFENGLPTGWTTTGLWNIGNACAPGGTCDGTRWAYYGQPASCTYNTGVTNSGTLTAPPLPLPPLPPDGTITLSYCSARQTESNSSYDLCEVRVNGTVVDTPPQSASFQTRTVNLSAYAGQTVTLQFRFDTVDNVSNNFRGWHVDNVVITATGTTCTDPCYANCDGSTAVPVLNVADFTCFLSRFAAGDLYANCDGSTAVPVLNVADFTCFLQQFAAGCSTP